MYVTSPSLIRPSAPGRPATAWIDAGKKCRLSAEADVEPGPPRSNTCCRARKSRSGDAIHDAGEGRDHPRAARRRQERPDGHERSAATLSAVMGTLKTH